MLFFALLCLFDALATHCGWYGDVTSSQVLGLVGLNALIAWATWGLR